MDGEFSRGAGRKDATGSRPDPAVRDRGTRRFPAYIRLRRTADYERVYRSTRPRSSARFTCYCLANELGYSRFGITLRASAGSAVRRNRIKRRVRELIRLHREEFPAGWDVIIHPKPEVARRDFGELTREFTSLLQRAMQP